MNTRPAFEFRMTNKRPLVKYRMPKRELEWRIALVRYSSVQSGLTSTIVILNSVFVGSTMSIVYRSQTLEVLLLHYSSFLIQYSSVQSLFFFWKRFVEEHLHHTDSLRWCFHRCWSDWKPAAKARYPTTSYWWGNERDAGDSPVKNRQPQHPGKHERCGSSS